MDRTTELIDRARDSYRHRLWPETFAQLSAADGEAPLGAAELDLLCTAAYLVGRDDDSDELSGRAYHAWLRAGEPAAAARRACWLGLQLLLRGEGVRAGAWYARATELVGDRDMAERGYVLLPGGLEQLVAGRARAALSTFGELSDLGDRFDDPDLKAIGRLGRGQALLAQGLVAEGMAFLDEAMVAVTADDVSPVLTGIVYCAVIEESQAAFDLRRAREWTTVLNHWCDTQPGLVPYRGQCLVHRAEIMQLQGSWQEAVDEARNACALLDGTPAGGAAFYALGELHRLRGALTDAERCYREASRFVATPQPGLALLRLAQNRVEEAAAASRRAVAEDDGASADQVSTEDFPQRRRSQRSRLLGAHVEIMLADGDVEAARAGADELRRFDRELDAPLLHALAEHAAGACLLAEGDGEAALATLRSAWAAWQRVDAPYESARVRVLAAQAHRLLGEQAPAEMELEAAAWVFDQLGAVPDLQRARRLSRRAEQGAAGPLTARELEVLRLVATGMTNRAIAGALFLSEKTVSRHLSNIFAKLDLASRAAATAYAYEHGLV
ncbi:MAG TPA: LuxR C-terminal-related transcriptional regulator [Nocardioidaceae bacterium]|nr:LuxR C-terminal-related transcriptional regulator [Nocardioidaceae bacterium]